MRSAQRKARIENGKKKVHIYGLLIKVFIPLVIFLSIILYLNLSTKYWNDHDKFSFAFQNSEGKVGVVVLDPALNEQTTLIIPGDTEVIVARSYGTLRIKNIWQLGVNEKLGGGLLAQTVTQSFLFPTNLWSDCDMSDVWKFIFASKQTNIPFGDRLAAGIFVLRINAIDKTEIDLGVSQFLRKQTLTDGKPGYVTAGNISGRLTIYFADNNFANKNIKFVLVDATGSHIVASKVGQILEVMGGKVVEVDKRAEETSFDCEVSGNNPDVVKKVAVLFSCKKIPDKSNFDLEMRLGTKFAKRF
jgi:hypothetical protein